MKTILVAMLTSSTGTQLFWVDSDAEFVELFIAKAKAGLDRKVPGSWDKAIAIGKTPYEVAKIYWDSNPAGETLVCRIVLPYGSFKNEP